MSRRFRGIARVIGPATIIALSPLAAFAWCGTGGCVYDGHTRYMWSRTWHGPNALATPLNQYYIPREPGNCGSGTYTGSLSCQGTAEMGTGGRYGGLPYPPDAAHGFEPMQFERLGRVPNELDIVGGMGAPATAAPPGPRR